MQYKLVYTAKSIIERDAVTSFLKKNCIPVQSPARDLSRKYTEQTVDLSLGAYSLFFDGFKIFVPEEQETFALESIEDFKKSFKPEFQTQEEQGTSGSNPTGPPKSQVNYAKKFYYCALISVIIPVIPLFYGLYFLYKALKNKNKFNTFYSLYAAGAYFFSIFVVIRLLGQGRL